MARLSATIRSRCNICDEEVAAMYRLYESYYDATSPSVFRSDLDGKQFVIALREGCELRGFSTLALIDFALEGCAGRALFSGDTIIDHRYWGEQTLARAFCHFAGRLKAAEPAVPLYWWLISKGYRTYRYLSVFSRSYYPNPMGQTPPEFRACIDALARVRFGSAYDPELGVVRYPSSHGHLKPQWATVKASARERPEVSYFLERNPRFHLGEELCCLTALEASNLRSFAKRAFLGGFDEQSCDDVLPGDCGLGDTVSRPVAAGTRDPAPAPARYS
jgi:hypothetical protein